MATKRSVAQSMQEVRTHFCDFSKDIPQTVSISSATATHTPPAGGVTLTPIVAVVSPHVNVTLGKLTIIGTHIVSIIAKLTDGEEIEIRLEIICEF